MVNVYITVDTETSLGGAWENSSWRPVAPERSIIGRIGSSSYGVPLIMDILEENEMRATFFAEVLAFDVVGRGELAEAYTPILRRGHDPQLHLHPVFHYYHSVNKGLLDRSQLPSRMDLIGSLPLAKQLELLEKGSSIFQGIFGARPTVFRAGSYGASLSTLDALTQVGIRFDSSFNPAYLETTCLLDSMTPSNMPRRHGAVWEIPITTFQTGLGRLRGLKPLEVSAVSLWEMLAVLDQAEKLGQHTVTVIMHSFAFLKRADIQFRRMRPDHLVIRRFRKFCEFLRQNRSRFRVLTFSQMPRPSETWFDVPFPHVGALLPGFRKFVQAVNRFYWV
jgi:peptidoglycan/xylan/chitin deacetylase (PgdA/CDA1 family)